MDEKLEKRRAYLRKYMQTYNRNPAYMAYRREWMKKWHRKHYKEIYARRRARPYEKLATTIRTRIRGLLKLGYKSANTERLLGCTVKELQVHIETQFLPGMTWENYGFYGWHVDHIIPLASFDLLKESEQKKAFHFTNLQPLWAKDNLKKHSKMV